MGLVQQDDSGLNLTRYGLTPKDQKYNRKELRLAWLEVRKPLSKIVKVYDQGDIREEASLIKLSHYFQDLGKAVWRAHLIACSQEQPLKNDTTEILIRGHIAELIAPTDVRAQFMKPLAYYTRYKTEKGYRPIHGQGPEEAVEFARKAYNEFDHKEYFDGKVRVASRLLNKYFSRLMDDARQARRKTS